MKQIIIQNHNSFIFIRRILRLLLLFIRKRIAIDTLIIIIINVKVA